MKNWISVLGLAFLCGLAQAASGRAVQLEIYGRGPAVDARAYYQVRRIVGDSVADGTVDKFVVYNYGIEGGFSACVELGRSMPDSQLQPLLDRFKDIQPDTRTTSYKVEAADKCK
jgi:hypothetical protein